MIPVGALKIRTQQRVIDLFRNRLGYEYIGNWREREGNRQVYKILRYGGKVNSEVGQRTLPLIDQKNLV